MGKYKKIIAAVAIVLAVVALGWAFALSSSKSSSAPNRYSEYTLKHSLKKEYTDKDLEKSQELINAIDKKDKRKIEKLINSGMELNCPNATENDDSLIQVPLGFACFIGDNETAKKLIKAGATAKYIKGTQSPIISVVSNYEKGDFELVKLLLRNGASPLEYETDADSPIFNASLILLPIKKYSKHDSEEATKIFKTLEKKGGKISDVNSLNFNVLIGAAVSNNLMLLKYLVEEKQMDINYKTKNGNTALICVSEFPETTGIVAYLLEHGADKTLVNNKGQTALDIAREAGILENINLLSK